MSETNDKHIPAPTPPNIVLIEAQDSILRTALAEGALDTGWYERYTHHIAERHGVQLIAYDKILDLGKGLVQCVCGQPCFIGSVCHRKRIFQSKMNHE